jgi:hypothetical protein
MKQQNSSTQCFLSMRLLAPAGFRMLAAGGPGTVLDTLLSIVVMAAILGGAAIFTEWFTRRAYYRCRRCAALNAKRRDQCRQCGEALP